MSEKDSTLKISYAEIPKRIEVKKRSTPEGVLPYDIDNLYPQRIELLVNSSPTALAVSNLYRKHIIGEGFLSESFNNAVINETGQTAGELLEEIGEDTRLGGYAIHFNYNALLQIVEARRVTFKFVRQHDDKVKGHQDQYAIYDDWDRVKSKKIEKKKILWVDKFDPSPEAIEAQVARATNAEGEVTGAFEDWNGQLMYVPEAYPLSPLDSAYADMETDMEMSLFRSSLSRRGFTGSYMVTSERSLESTDGKDLNGIIKEAQGARNGGSIITLEGVGVDNNITFQRLETIGHDGLFEETENKAQKNIRKSVLAPKELTGEEFLSGFSTTLVAEMRDYYNSVTEEERGKISKQFKKFIPLFDRNLNPGNDYKIQPLKIKVDGTVD